VGGGRHGILLNYLKDCTFRIFYNYKKTWETQRNEK
jgi:hypothetical protein